MHQLIGIIAESSSILTRFLDNVVTWNESLNALDKQKRAASETRRLGLGVMGVADMLNQLGIGYDSKEGVRINDTNYGVYNKCIISGICIAS